MSRESAHTERPRILIVDDDPTIVDWLCEILARKYEVVGETSALAALARLEADDFAVVIQDLEMPEMRGAELMTRVFAFRPRQPIIVITAFGSIHMAVETVRAGACDFVTKPFKIEILDLAIERALRERTMRREIVRLRQDLGEPAGESLVTVSDEMKRALDVARRAARSSSTVLITGESGTGKSALAHWIHEHGDRRNGPFVQVNCAALPIGLLEGELFGVRRGAYTDARESRDGLMKEASGGTLFLDEIADMPLEAQAKLLQALESSRIRPLGGSAEVPIDIRLIAATNRDLDVAIQQGTFRTDLFYRINVIGIELAPLRAHSEDIPDLVNAFLRRAARERADVVGITDEAMRWLCARKWPGNVRELANVIERAVALTDHDTITLADVRDHVSPQRPTEHLSLTEAVDQHMTLAQVELSYIEKVVASVEGNMMRAARLLGIDRRTLYRRLAGA